ncbi:YeiH family protein [Arthrobacter agilis]|uniref:YeiH family protein n=1 Tax=Arthrobacter agilis TaxID=37921 RepID=UPI002781A959|nr:putative sulfate exporter family transporter [Arthrobacter agilis]MDQ0735255.1 putative integral membrane protein (TIGR00698 family) [Arthrobacter agilis]
MTPAPSGRPAGVRARTAALAPGLAVVAAGVAVALWVGSVQSVVGALVIALVLGVLFANSTLYAPALRRGVTAGTKKLLRAGVVLLGLQLALPDIVALGLPVLGLIVACVALSYVLTLHLGLRLGLTRAGATLMAAGFSICGASAIAGLQGVVDADDDETAGAVAMVTLYGSLMIVVLPVLGGLLGLGEDRFGMWAGLAVHEVAQVVAVAGTAGATALAVATVVKLGRVLMLAPVAAVASLGERRRAARAGADQPTAGAGLPGPSAARTGIVPGNSARPPVVPLFVLGFLAMVAVRSLGVLPLPVLDGSRTVTTVLLAAGMFGLGAGIDVRRLLRTGGRFAVVGALSTVLLAGGSLVGVLLAG